MASPSVPIFEPFTLPITCGRVLGARVQLWRTKTRLPGEEFDLTGYTTFWSSVKQTPTDASELFRITVSLSAFDANGGPVTPDKGWLELYAATTETDNGQSIAETDRRGFFRSVRPNADLVGLDSNGNRMPLGVFWAELYPATTENFA